MQFHQVLTLVCNPKRPPKTNFLLLSSQRIFTNYFYVNNLTGYFWVIKNNWVLRQVYKNVLRPSVRFIVFHCESTSAAKCGFSYGPKFIFLYSETFFISETRLYCEEFLSLQKSLCSETFLCGETFRQSLVASWQSLVTSPQFLVTNYQYLFTSHQSLVTRYQLLVTSHQLLVTSYLLIIVSGFYLVMFLVRMIFAENIQKKDLVASAVYIC